MYYSLHLTFLNKKHVPVNTNLISYPPSPHKVLGKPCQWFMKQQVQFHLFLFLQKESCLHFILLVFVGFCRKNWGFKKQANKVNKQIPGMS